MIRIFIFTLLVCFSCRNEDCCGVEEYGGEQFVGEEQLLGKWLLYEEGYSPGAGYIVNDVSPNPPQTLVLKEHNEMTSTIEGLEEYKFYLVLEDTINDKGVLSLYKAKPDIYKEDVNNLAHSYLIDLENKELKLYFRYCIEGCHLGLKIID